MVKYTHLYRNFYFLIFFPSILFLIHFSAYGQGRSLLDKQVKLTQAQATVESLLNELSKAGGFTFSISEDLLIQNKIINLNISRKHCVSEWLGHIFKEEEMEYLEQKGMLIIRKKSPAGTGISSRTIQGTVLSETGEPLALAWVYIQSRAGVTHTDSSGHFVLGVPPGEKTILVSCIGFHTREIELTDKQEIQVLLKYKINSLEEVVVTGYGSQQKKEVLGSITSIKASRIEESPAMNLEMVLQGKVSGVQVVHNSGAPGGEIMLRIRGNSSIMAINKPMYIIDGVPIASGVLLDTYFWEAGGQHLNYLNLINPQDIASIDIVKDAASASIYGSRGGNGIVLITTKQGKTAGKFSVHFDTYGGIQSIPGKYDLMNASEYSQYAMKAIGNAGGSSDTPAVYAGHNTDWQKEIMRSGETHQYNFSLSGHDSLTNYYISGRWLGQKGVIIGSGSDNKNIRLNLGRKMGRKLTFGTSLNGNNSFIDRVFEGFSPYSVYKNALLRNPNLPVYDNRANFSDDPMKVENPVQSAREADISAKQLRFTGTLFAELQILKDLVLRSAVSSDYFFIKEMLLLPPYLQTNRGSTKTGLSDEKEIVKITDHTLIYKTGFKKSEVQLLGGTAFQKTEIDRRTILKSRDQNGAIWIDKTEFVKLTVGIDSYFSQLHYSWSNKYLLSLAARADGTTRFGDKIRYGFFPSASAGWRISEEAFMQAFRFINDLKLRIGYGVTGNQEGLTQYNAKGMGTGPPPKGLNVGALPDLNLAWERVVQKNTGLDMTLLNSRMILAADIYVKTSKNVLVNMEKMLDSVKYTAMENVGSIENRGLDLLLQTRNLEGIFEWSTEWNLSFISNKVIRMDVKEGSQDIERMDAYPMEATSANLAGYYYGSFYGYIYKGVDPATGKASYQDLNGDGIITEKDETIIGRSVPKSVGGLTNSFLFKGLELNILMQWSYGNQVYNLTRAVLESPYYADKYNGSKESLNYWKSPGDQTNIPKPLIDSQSKNERKMSSKFVEDGSFIKLRSITLNYYFPESITHRFKIKKLKAYFSVYNVYTLTKYTGLDPEAQNQLSRNTMLGVDSFSYPNPSTFITGMSISM